MDTFAECGAETEDEANAREESFWRWYNTELIAAEQREAVKALREAATAIEKNQVIIDGDHFQPCNSCMSIHMQFLDHRADQMEGNE